MRHRIIKTYAKLCKEEKRMVGWAELTHRLKVSRSSIRHYFDNLALLKAEAKAEFPKAFEKVIDEELFNEQTFRQVKNEARKYKRFLITTVVPHASVDLNALKSVDLYCKKNNALPLFIISNNNLNAIDPVLINRQIVFDDLKLNSKVSISTIKIDPKAQDPLSGILRLGDKDGTLIFASPKQRLEFVPTSQKRLPHAKMTTGAITKPSYLDTYQKSKSLALADVDHVMGGIILEVENDTIFHFRQIQFDTDGSFADLGKLYSTRSVKEYAPQVMVWGDYHSIEKDELAESAFIEVAKVTNTPEIIIHDGFDGKSINHHEMHKNVSRSHLFEEGKLSLESELKIYAKDLNNLSNLFDRITLVESNHDDFLARYLQDGRWTKEANNYKMASLLNAEMVKKNNPLIEGLKLCGLANTHKLNFLTKDDSYKVAGIELGQHGDKGSNGAKGSHLSIEKGLGNSVTGHTHSPKIWRNTWIVGCICKLIQDYNKGGTSSWFHTSCLVYPNGQRQLINVVYGKWRT